MSMCPSLRRHKKIIICLCCGFEFPIQSKVSPVIAIRERLSNTNQERCVSCTVRAVLDKTNSTKEGLEENIGLRKRRVAKLAKEEAKLTEQMANPKYQNTPHEIRQRDQSRLNEVQHKRQVEMSAVEDLKHALEKVGDSN